MLGEKEKEKLLQQYKRMNTQKSWEYTEKVLLEMGKKIQKEFPGVDFILKARGKSIESFNGKIERMNSEEGRDSTDIYDIHGLRLIIKGVSNDFNFEHALCKLNVAQRIRLALAIKNESTGIARVSKKYNDALAAISKYGNVDEIEQTIEMLKAGKSFKGRDEAIKALEGAVSQIKMLTALSADLYKELTDRSVKFIKVGKQYYKFTDDYINSMMATHIMNTITKDSEFMKTLDLKVIPGRKKFHSGGKSGFYRAFHDTLGCTTKGMDWWKLEIQALSYADYLESKDGMAKHSCAVGKERILPDFENEAESRAKIKEDMLRKIPQNLIYQNAPYIDGKIQEELADVYRCSDVENMMYYYIEVLAEVPDLFYDLISDKSMFSDKGEHFVHRDYDEDDDADR